MTRRNIIYFLLACFMHFLLAGCNNNDDFIVTMMEVPTIIGYDNDFKCVTLHTPMGIFMADVLNDLYIIDILPGDPLLSFFSVNYDKQQIQGYTSISHLDYALRLIKELPQATEDGKSTGEDFEDFIDKIDFIAMVSDKTLNNYVAFFKFTHNVHEDEEDVRFIYEMTYDPDEDSDIPTVYIRAKKMSDTGAFQAIPATFFYTFDLSNFLIERRDSDNKLKVNIKYAYSIENSEFFYQYWSGNPLELDFE